MPAILRSPKFSRVLATAILLAALLIVAAVMYALAVPPSRLEFPPTPASTGRRAALEQCTEAALLFHDVRWATACMVLAEQDEARHSACLKDAGIMGNPQLGRRYCDSTFTLGDGSAECNLPDARAASLDVLLRDAEQKCQAEFGAR